MGSKNLVKQRHFASWKRKKLWNYDYSS